MPPRKTAKNNEIRDDLELNDINFVQANVCTLHPAELKQAQTKQNCGSTARMIFLDEAFAAIGANIACVQEGRLRDDGLHSCKNFRMYRSGADAHGSFGVQIWILHKLVRLVTAVNPISPRLMQVVMQIGPLFLHIVSAHAPTEDADEACKEAFWSSLRLLLVSIGPADENLVLVGIDANARIGEIVGPGIGHAEPSCENQNGSRLRELLHECELTAVNTHFDAGATWTSSFGTTARIDYTLASSRLFGRTASCSTRSDIDLATAIRDDHTALFTCFNDVAGLLGDMAANLGRADEFKHARQQQARKYTAISIRDPENTWFFQNAVATKWMGSCTRRGSRDSGCTLAPVGALTPREIEGDLKLLTSAIRDAADECFDAQPPAQHKAWLSTQTWDIVSFGNQLRSARRRALRSQRTHLLGFAFRLWLAALSEFSSGSSGHVILCSATAACRTFESVFRNTDWHIAALERNLWSCCRLRGQYIACDKAASIENAAEEAQRAADSNDSKKLFTIVRRLAGVPARSLSTLKDAAGKVVSSSADLVVLWRNHFCSVFKAGIVSNLPAPCDCPGGGPAEPAEATENQDEEEYTYIDWSTFEQAQQLCRQGFAPCLDDVEAVIGALKGDSSVGPDRISAWILKAGGRALAVIILELINQILVARHVPTVWRGGRLVVLFKGKGSASDPDNYRGILVADHLGKILTALVQRHLNSLYGRVVGESQFGAVAGRGTPLASLSLRSFSDACMARGWCLFILFIDLSKAFDYAIREVVMGWMGPMANRSANEKRAHLHKLGVLPEHSAELVAWIDETGGLMRAAGADEGVVALMASLHSGSWFQLPNDDKFIVSIAGGRQGCKLGALVFNSIYSVALARIRAELCKFNIILQVKANDDMPFWSGGGASTSFSNTCLGDPTFHQVVEVTYVDDEAFHVAASTPKCLMAAIPVVMRNVCQVFRYFGFKVNWKPGKTECFITLRGKHAEPQKQKLRKRDGEVTFPLPPECGHPELRVVRRYVHLGSGLDGNCGPSPDVQLRTTSAMSAFTPIAKKVFGNPWVSRAVRLRLLSSLILSRLLYNVATWSVLTQSAYNKLNSVYMRVLRRIADRMKYSAESAHSSGSDAYVRTLLGAPSLQCLIVQRRLMLLGSVLKHGSSRLLALLAVRGRDNQPLPWVKMILDDLRRLASFHGHKVSELGDPAVNGDRWMKLIQDWPVEWRSLVRALHFNTMELDTAFKVGTISGKWGSQPPSSHRCVTCGLLFKSSKALETHMKSKHKTQASASSKIGRSCVCPCCYTQFASRTRLLAHVSEKRNRGTRTFSCSNLCASNLVKAVDAAEFEEAVEIDKRARTSARKSGHTVPLSESLAKRPKTGTSILAQQRAWKRKAEDGQAPSVLPGNALDLDRLRPLRRVRRKASQEDVVAQHLHLQLHV